MEGTIDGLLTFMHKKTRYILSDHSGLVPITGLEVSTTRQLLSYNNLGITDNEIIDKRAIYGINEINVEMPSIPAIFYYEIFNPFYVFQIFSYILWMVDEYAFYATTILIITLISITLLIRDIYTQRKRLSKIVAKHNAYRATCWRNHSWTDIASSDLVPGDVIQIFAGPSPVPADCVIIAGEVVVDESMLTGESVPATKLPISEKDIFFAFAESKIHLLHAGTEVVQTRSSDGICKAVIVRTGFNTSRGSLVRAVLFPKPINMKFEHDGLMFVGVMGIIASLGFVYTIITQYFGCISVGQVVVKGEGYILLLDCGPTLVELTASYLLLNFGLLTIFFCERFMYSKSLNCRILSC